LSKKYNYVINKVEKNNKRYIENERGFNMSTKELVKSEVEDYAKFDIIRYAQVWEDAEVLLEALDIN